MIATLALLATLGAAPAGPVKIAAPLLEGVNLSEELTAFYSDHLAQQLASHGLKVTNPRDVGQVLGLERQRELLGVQGGDNANLIEIGKALGVEGLVSGSIAKLGGAYQVNLRIIHAQTAETLTTFSERVRSEEQLLDSLNRAARRLAPAVESALRSATPAESLEAASVKDPPGVASSSRPSRQWWWVPMAASAGAGVVGALFIAEGNKVDGTLKNPPVGYTPQMALVDRDRGQRSQVLGGILVTVGVAGMLTGAGLYLFGGNEEGPQVTVVPSDTPTIVLQGAF